MYAAYAADVVRGSLWVSLGMAAVLAFLLALPLAGLVLLAGPFMVPGIACGLLAAYAVQQLRAGWLAMEAEGSVVICLAIPSPVYPVAIPVAVQPDEVHEIAGTFPRLADDTVEPGYSDMADPVEAMDNAGLAQTARDLGHKTARRTWSRDRLLALVRGGVKVQVAKEGKTPRKAPARRKAG